ncbi:MAG: alpha/beta hydrolase [Bacteriovoracaceae bacterium]|nr:alpha/beta hydrolase [Bacteriovoracaceae bacterium]
MKKYLGIFSLIVLIGTSYSAQSETDPCGSINEILTISRSSVPNDNKSPLFDYRFRYLKGISGAPVVIYLPGGPGQSSINTNDPRYDSSYGYIQTDPRGVGCNNLNVPELAINSETFAADIVALVKYLKLDNYILYGVSYGTSLASRVAYEIERTGITPPKALVLEGVVSRSFKLNEKESSYHSAWEKIKDLLPPNVQQVLSQEETPLGLSSELWAMWIKRMLMLGKLPNNNFSLENFLNMLVGTTSEKDLLRNIVSSANEGPSQDEFRVYKTIVCKELYEEDYDSKLLHGIMVTDYAAGDGCSGIPLINPFDIKDFPFHGTIYYFSGENDPATPPNLAQYHFDNQPFAKKFLVHVKEGGHNSLQVNLSDCKSKIWAEILQNGNRIDRVLQGCQLETSLTTDP